MSRCRSVVLLGVSALALLCCACRHARFRIPMLSDAETPIAELPHAKLYLSDVLPFIPAGISSSDSAAFINDYVEKWAKRELFYDRAVHNIGNTDEIDRLTADYRRTLITEQYRRNLDEKRVRMPSSDEVEAFYNAHPEEFRLRDGLVHGVYLKVPLTAPQTEQIRRQFNNLSKFLPDIERYSYQNAVAYEYFMDTWQSRPELERKFPRTVLLRRGLQEASDEQYRYFLWIAEFRQIGESMPLDYVAPEISSLLRTEHARAYFTRFEDELFQSALKKDRLVLHPEVYTPVADTLAD